MASKIKHLAVATENLRIADAHLSHNDHLSGWVAVLFFYAAVHYLEAYLDTGPQRIHPENHGHRNNLVARNFSDSVYKSYSELKDRSEDVRYNCKELSFDFISRDLRQQIENCKSAFEASIRKNEILYP